MNYSLNDITETIKPLHKSSTKLLDTSLRDVFAPDSKGKGNKSTNK